MATATRPQGFEGSPVAVFSSRSLQFAPPSVVLKSPLPLKAPALSPPERKVHPLRRKSHMPANSTLGFCLSIEIIEHPVEGLAPLSIFAQVFPPSVVLYTPRSSLSLHSFPGTAT